MTGQLEWMGSGCFCSTGVEKKILYDRIERMKPLVIVSDMMTR